MNEHEVLEILRKVGAIIENDHFRYTSGRHGPTYINKDALYMHPRETSLLTQAIAQHFVEKDVEVVLGPVLGGIILSQWVAYHLSELTHREVLSVYAEKGEKTPFVIRRGYDRILAEKRVLVVEDILTTGRSVRNVIEATRTHGGTVIGLGALCNRGKVTTEDVAHPPTFFSLLTLNLFSWEEKECPLCAQGIPINTNVKGKDKEGGEKK